MYFRSIGNITYVLYFVNPLLRTIILLFLSITYIILSTTQKLLVRILIWIHQHFENIFSLEKKSSYHYDRTLLKWYKNLNI